MKANIVFQGFQATAAMREYIGRRLSFALDRTQDFIRGAVVRLTDVNGPRGGIDKTCRVELSLSGQAPVIVTESSATAEHAINRAIHRAAQVLSRRLHKSRKRQSFDKRANSFALDLDAQPQSS